MHLLAIIVNGIFTEIPIMHISYITAHNLADLILKWPLFCNHNLGGKY